MSIDWDKPLECNHGHVKFICYGAIYCSVECHGVVYDVVETSGLAKSPILRMDFTVRNPMISNRDKAIAVANNSINHGFPNVNIERLIGALIEAGLIKEDE